MPDVNPFLWHELVTPDQQASGEFYRRLFGWTSKAVDAGPFGTYTLFQMRGRDVAGMMNPTALEGPGKGAYWHAYLEVDDVDDCAKRAAQLGGSVLVPPHEVPEFGRVCAIADALGGVIHVVQPPRMANEPLSTSVLKAITDAFNAHDLDAIMAFFADDCTFDMPRGPDPWGKRLTGKAAVREGFASRFKGLPDVHYGEDRHWVSGDQGVSEWLLTGTTPDGVRVQVRGCDLWEFREGKVVRKDSYWKIVEPGAAPRQ